MNLELFIPVFLLTIISINFGYYLGKKEKCNCETKKDFVINFPKFKKIEPVIYEEKQTEENEKSNYFYK